MDWREQLSRNERRTRYVIALFIMIYLLVGLLVDMVMAGEPNLDLSQIFLKLVTFQVVPIATLIMGGVAVLSLWITYAFYDKLMLMGTDYQEVTARSSSMQKKQLYHVVEELKIAAGLRFMPKIYLIKADYMNAFASGYSEKSAMVAITEGLMEKLTRNELQAVMAHELSHIRHHDIKLTLTASVLSNLILMAIDGLFFSLLYGRGDKRDNRLFIIVLLLRYILPLVNVLLILYLSRTREYMADAGCVELMRDNTPLAQALLKIDQDYKQNREHYDQPANEGVRRAAYLYDPAQAGFSPIGGGIANLFSTHPAMKDRLAALGYKEKI